MIELKDLSVETKGFNLDSISLKIEKGSFHCLIGPTGCGKTTLLEAILGLIKIKKGKIFLEGSDITNLPVHKRGFSYLPQDLAIFPHLSVEENILYGIKYSKVSEKEKRYKEVWDLVEFLGIKHLLKRRAAYLSGGEKQRVALIRALAPGNKYILLDEPLTALHEGLKKELWFLLKELQKRYHLTFLMVTHDLEEAFFLADFVSIMINGKIEQSDRKEILYKFPSTLKIASFLGIKNIFKGKITGIEGNFYKVYSPDLKAELVVNIDRIREISEGDTIYLGIRSEDIMILRLDLPLKKDNLLTGIVREIFPMGANVLILCEPDNSEKLLEIKMPEYAATKLSLHISKKILLSLRSEKLFGFKGFDHPN